MKPVPIKKAANPYIIEPKRDAISEVLNPFLAPTNLVAKCIMIADINQLTRKLTKRVVSTIVYGNEYFYKNIVTPHIHICIFVGKTDNKNKR